jgi:hypothetical protein
MRLRHLLLCAALTTGCTTQAEPSPACNTSFPSACDDILGEEVTGDVVTGATVEVKPVRATVAAGQAKRYRVTSSAPDVAEVVDAEVEDACGRPSVRLKTRKAGNVTLTYTEVGSAAQKAAPLTATVAIVDPAQVTAFPYAEALLQHKAARDARTPDARPVTTFMLALGGHTGILLRYTDANGALLRGTGAAKFEQITGLTTVRLPGKREGLELYGTGVGARALDIVVGQAKLRLDVNVVPVDAVTGVQLFVESEQGAKDGELLGVLARANDAQGNIVYGAPISMQVGDRFKGVGDLIRYPYRAGAPQRLIATAGVAGVARTETTLFVDVSRPDAIAIGSSQRDLAGCQVGGIGGGGSAGFMAIAALLAKRRASRRRSARI